MNYPYHNFYEMLCAAVKDAGARTAIFIDEDKISYRELKTRCDRFASFLTSKGIVKGDIVTLVLPNSLEFVIALFAVSKIGAVFSAVNNFLKRSEYEYIFNDSKAKLLITSAKYKKEVLDIDAVTPLEYVVWIDEKPIEKSAYALFSEGLKHEVTECNAGSALDDLAVIFYTSGTTGFPKGAMITNRNIFANIVGANDCFKIHSKDRFIVYLPMFHSFTFTATVLLPFYSRSPLVIVRSIVPFSNIMKQVLLKRVSIFLGVPDVYNALVRAKLPWYFKWFNRIRIFVSGGSALSNDTLERYKKVFKKATMLEGYGLSECSPVVSVNTLQQQKAGTVGQPLKGVEAKVVDSDLVECKKGNVGELIVKGDCVMRGYLHHPDITDETIINGWLKTGDLATIDEDGFITIVDRIKDLIISKGLNIYPREIEEQLVSMKEIRYAAVIGLKESGGDEIPVAFVELEEGIEAIDEAQVKRELKRVLANFKIPKHIRVVEELPKNATGKVLKRALRETLNKNASP